MGSAPSWRKAFFRYTDDLGRVSCLGTNDYIGHAGGLVECTQSHGHSSWVSRPRKIKVKSAKPYDGKKYRYQEIPVQEKNPLWTGELGQVVKVGGEEMITIEKISERKRMPSYIPPIEQEA